MSMENLGGAKVLLLPLALLMALLGWWQMQRMQERQNLLESFENAQGFALDTAVADAVPYARVISTGRFDFRRHLLLDNQVLDGRAGVHVLTPFTTISGMTILVNRGWLPLAADRRSFPKIATPSVPVSIKGILAPPPEHRQKLGLPDHLSSDEWPQLVTYLDLAAAGEALDSTLPPWVVWLAKQDPSGFEGRDWSPVVTSPQRHGAYAVQWFALAVTAAVAWLVLVIQARSRNQRRGDGP